MVKFDWNELSSCRRVSKTIIFAIKEILQCIGDIERGANGSGSRFNNSTRFFQ